MQLKEGRINFDSQSEDTVLHGEGKTAGVEGSWSPCVLVMKQRWMNADTQPTFPFYPVQDPSPQDYTTHIWGEVFLTLLNLSVNTVIDMLSHDSKSNQVGYEDEPSHTHIWKTNQ